MPPSTHRSITRTRNNEETHDASVADPATKDRVTDDKDDGLALEVAGTPTFFLDGRRIQPASVEEFRSLIESAIAD